MSLQCALCNAPTDLLCQGCTGVAYCCHDCQRKHWHEHCTTCRRTTPIHYSDM